MTRFLIALLSLSIAACAVAGKPPASPPVAPRKPRIDGSVHAVFAADIRKIPALMPGHFREQQFKPVPIVGIHVVDHNTVEVHYSPDTFTYARRIKGHWRIDYADTERVKVTGSYIHAGL
jgi:hypothetical protein